MQLTEGDIIRAVVMLVAITWATWPMTKVLWKELQDAKDNSTSTKG